MPEKNQTPPRRRQRTGGRKQTPDEYLEYRQIKYTALAEAGGDWEKLPAAARKFGIPLSALRRGFYAARGRAIGYAFQEAAIKAGTYRGEMDVLSVAGMKDSMKHNEDYNRGRSSFSWAFGNGLLKKDAPPPGVQNNFFVNIQSQKEAEDFIERGRISALAAGIPDGASAVLEATATETDQGRQPVVAQKRNKDVQPAVGVARVRRSKSAVPKT